MRIDLKAVEKNDFTVKKEHTDRMNADVARFFSGNMWNSLGRISIEDKGRIDIYFRIFVTLTDVFQDTLMYFLLFTFLVDIFLLISLENLLKYSYLIDKIYSFEKVSSIKINSYESDYFSEGCGEGDVCRGAGVCCCSRSGLGGTYEG